MLVVSSENSYSISISPALYIEVTTHKMIYSPSIVNMNKNIRNEV